MNCRSGALKQIVEEKRIAEELRLKDD